MCTNLGTNHTPGRIGTKIGEFFELEASFCSAVRRQRSEWQRHVIRRSGGKGMRVWNMKSGLFLPCYVSEKVTGVHAFNGGLDRRENSGEELRWSVSERKKASARALYLASATEHVHVESNGEVIVEELMKEDKRELEDWLWGECNRQLNNVCVCVFQEESDDSDLTGRINNETNSLKATQQPCIC